MDLSMMSPKKYAAMQEKLILATPGTGLHKPCKPVLSEKTRKSLALKKMDSYAEPRLPGAAGQREYVVGVGTYNGAELRPYDNRPRALDAYAIKSRGFST
jgi:hypothetical protein